MRSLPSDQQQSRGVGRSNLPYSTFGLRYACLACFGILALVLMVYMSGQASGSGSGTCRYGHSSEGASRRFLVLTATNCGEFEPKPWIRPQHSGAVGGYDVVVFDYSADFACSKGPLGSAMAGRTLLHRPKTYKFPAMAAYFASPEGLKALTEYDDFMLSDDDVDFHGGVAAVLRLFHICANANMYICQPSLSSQSAFNWDITLNALKGTEGGGGDAVTAAAALDSTAHIRLTRLVEQMTPVFTREALMQFLPFFKGVTHAWGIDALWSDQSERLDRRVGVVDSVVIDHMRPSGISALYKRVGGIDKAREDQLAFKERYGVREEYFTLMENGHAGYGERITTTNFVLH